MSAVRTGVTHVFLACFTHHIQPGLQPHTINLYSDTIQSGPTLGLDFPPCYLTFKVLFRILSWCSFSLTTGSLHLFIKDFLYSSLVEIRRSPKGDRLACSKALYKSCKESAAFSSIVSTVMRKGEEEEEKIEKGSVYH